jgi:hypothetical protein
MDLTQLTPAGVAGPLAALAAAGSAITLLTEVTKQYLTTDRVPPPVIAATIAAVFTAAWVASQDQPPRPGDAMSILLIWVALFQVSIGVYHGAQLGAKARQADEVGRKLDTQAASYERFMALRDQRIADLEAQVAAQADPSPAFLDAAPPVSIGGR